MKGIKGFQKGHQNHLSKEQIDAFSRSRKGVKLTVEQKQKISTSNKRAFAEGRKSVKGEKNPAWKGGITTEQQKARNSTEYFIWRNEVYRKDNWTCRICKKHCRKGQIVAHHLQLFSEFPELRYSVDNGVVLCRSCHAALHKGSKTLPEYGY